MGTHLTLHQTLGVQVPHPPPNYEGSVYRGKKVSSTTIQTRNLETPKVGKTTSTLLGIVCPQFFLESKS